MVSDFGPPGPRSALAIVVGVHAYSTLADCPRSVADASDVAGVLATAGFSGALLLNPTRDVLLMHLDAIAQRTQPGSTCIVYFSGHSVLHDHEVHVLLAGEPGESGQWR